MNNIDIEIVQNKILEIVKYFDEFCLEHDITYYLMGGSALGAMRHQGFIPWDDDLDVFMTYDNYMKFIRVARKNLNTEKYYLQEENTLEWPMFFTKLRMNNTTYIEADTKNRNMHQGFFIDIMCLNNTSKNVIIRYLQFICARLLTAHTLAVRGYLTRSRIKKIAMFFAKYIVVGPVKRLLLNFVRGMNKKESMYIGHFFGRAKFKNTTFLRSFLGSPRYVKFENIELPVMENVEEYLTTRFGSDWMKMPSKEVRNNYPIHAIFVDTEKAIDWR